MGDGFVEGGCRVIPQQLLEPAEGTAGSGKKLRRLGRLVADGGLHKGVDPPGPPLSIGVIGLAVFGAQHLQGLPAAVAASLLDLAA